MSFISSMNAERARCAEHVPGGEAKGVDVTEDWSAIRIPTALDYNDNYVTGTISVPKTIVGMMALAMILDAAPREKSFTKDSLMTITVRMQAWVWISQAQK